MKKVEKLDEAEKIFEITNPFVERGKIIGRKEGREEGRKEVALEMLKKGLSIDLICRSN